MKPEGVGIGPIRNPDCRAVDWMGYPLAGFPWTFTRAGADGSLLNSRIEGPGLLPDWAIREFVTITPFVDYGECPKGVVSYGLTSAGYDLRVGYKFKVFTNCECATVDPKDMKPAVFRDFDLTPHAGGHEWDKASDLSTRCKWCGLERGREMLNECSRRPQPANHVLIPPNCFALAETVETVHIPRNVCCWCIGKSTYARCGINMNFTPFEPGWFGVVTVEIINATPLPVKIYAGEGIGQAQFFLLAGDPERGYGDKPNAKYQGQTGLTLPKVT